jgi:hypothetical protein
MEQTQEVTNALLELEKQHAIGQVILVKLFSLNKSDLLKKINEICGKRIFLLAREREAFFSNASTEKVIKDDEPYSISIYRYDTIEISWVGICYKPKHSSQEMIVEFDDFFKLDLP